MTGSTASVRSGARPAKALLAAGAVLALLAACAPKPAAAPPVGRASVAGGGVGAPVAATPASGPPAPALTPGDGPTTFTDPTENAFTIDAPVGWRVVGGVRRISSVVALPWAQALSADGATAVFTGDGSIPVFVLPSQQHPAGSRFDSVAGPQMAMDYRTGAQFADAYVRGAAPCTGLQPQASQPEPEVASRAQSQAQADMAATNTSVTAQTNFDGGSATFTCQISGKPYVIGVFAVTAITRFGQGGVWQTPTIFGYRAPADQQQYAERVARTFQASFVRQPQWLRSQYAAVRQAVAQIRSQGAQDMAAQQAQANANMAASRQRGDAFAAAQAARQSAYMNGQNAQRDARNTAFANRMDQRDVNQQREMRYIQNQRCAVWWDAGHTHCRYTVGN